MVDTPVTLYTECDGLYLAYQVFGDGDFDLVFVPGGVSHIDIGWQDRRYERFMRRLGSFARVTVFDTRGMGASDPVATPPTLEQRAEDIRAVMDAAGVEQASLIGLSGGGTSAAMFAATFPHRTRALVLCSSFPGGGESRTPSPATRRSMDGFWSGIAERWKKDFGQGITVELFAPSLGGIPSAVAAMAAFERAASTPAGFRALIDSMHGFDLRPVLTSISVPTLVIHRRDEAVPVEGARYMASRIAGAKLVVLEGDDHLPWLGDMDALVDEVQEFMTGVRPGRAERRLATVLFTATSSGSTELATKLGDRRWRALLEDHHDALRSSVERFDGRLVKTIGDGALALFDGPARALECARETVGDAAGLGIEIRAGVHAGECELIGEDVGGIAVHVGARIAALAGAGEVLVSSTVKDLVAGSDLAFEDRGVHELKGLAAEWRLYGLA